MDGTAVESSTMGEDGTILKASAVDSNKLEAAMEAGVRNAAATTIKRDTGEECKALREVGPGGNITETTVRSIGPRPRN